MKIFVILLFQLFLVFQLNAQDLIHWKNLKIDATTPDEAITILGKPKKDKIKKNETDELDSSGAKKQYTYRKIDFKSIDEFKEVFLIFIDDKLVQISLTPKNKTILASDLESIFATDFLFLEGFPKGGLKYSEFEGQKETSVPKVYPTSYFMLCVKSEIKVIASVDNNSWKAIWRDGIKKPTMEKYPGYVQNIGIFTRTIE